ncbi:MAG: prepilin-type N-terminal cleavage/methylation domain-containing protein [Candidatus Omnitrophica bacterium]|nr:prepilin-type N-terminal cleavage/methylation domain-containing protein [Candidatus Omnitrophota bacterium]
MKRKGMAMVEIVVSMLILAVAALAVTATVSMVNGKEMRSAGGSSLDLQALSYARETLESLKSAVSTDATRAAPLQTSATPYNTTSTLPAAFQSAPISGTRTYTVEDVPGTDLKKVKVTVQWTD